MKFPWTFLTLRKLVSFQKDVAFYRRKAIEGNTCRADHQALACLLCRNGLNMRPNPFDCRITPRSTDIRTTIDREGQQALQDLSRFDGETQYRMSTYYAAEKL